MNEASIALGLVTSGTRIKHEECKLVPSMYENAWYAESTVGIKLRRLGE